MGRHRIIAIAIAIALAALLALAGCSGQAASSAPASQPQASGAASAGSADGGSESAMAGTSQEGMVEGSANDQEAAQMMVRIITGDHAVTAELYDNDAARELWGMLPLTLEMQNLYGREMCYRFGAGALPTDEASDRGYEVGDVSYWPPAGSLVILYKQNGEVFEQQPIGHTDDDISFFDGMPDTEITFEKAN